MSSTQYLATTTSGSYAERIHLSNMRLFEDVDEAWDYAESLSAYARPAVWEFKDGKKTRRLKER